MEIWADRSKYIVLGNAGKGGETGTLWTIPPYRVANCLLPATRSFQTAYVAVQSTPKSIQRHKAGSPPNFTGIPQLHSRSFLPERAKSRQTGRNCTLHLGRSPARYPSPGELRAAQTEREGKDQCNVSGFQRSGTDRRLTAAIGELR